MPLDIDSQPVGARSGVLPQFPAIPPEVLAKYPELKAWDKALKEFWTSTRFVLSRQQEQLQLQLDRTWSAPS